jgi:glycosyltransferase involved in cell wall biosynthesis
MPSCDPPRVAVIIPCKDEEGTIAAVLQAFRAALPAAELVVVDNNCTDRTASVARDNGARVLRETRPGKGHAVRKAFREVAADVYLMVDGDDTYPAEEAPRLIQPILEDRADVVVGARLASGSKSEFNVMNRMGNRLLLGVLNVVFRARLTDLLSGYRAMSREYARQSPILSSGFELETEMSVLALERGFRTLELPVHLKRRPQGSRSKIELWRDGRLILGTIFALLRDYRPLSFFGGAGVLCVILGLLPGIFVTYEFTRTGAVRIPTAVLATGLEISGLTLLLAGITLTALNRRFRELDERLRALESDLRQGRPQAPGD